VRDCPTPTVSDSVRTSTSESSPPLHCVSRSYNMHAVVANLLQTRLELVHVVAKDDGTGDIRSVAVHKPDSLPVEAAFVDILIEQHSKWIKLKEEEVQTRALLDPLVPER
jgi:hypothetical protein